MHYIPAESVYVRSHAVPYNVVSTVAQTILIYLLLLVVLLARVRVVCSGRRCFRLRARFI